MSFLDGKEQNASVGMRLKKWRKSLAPLRKDGVKTPCGDKAMVRRHHEDAAAFASMQGRGRSSNLKLKV